MQRVAEGDLEATRAVGERMSPRVTRVARAIMGGSLDAQDAAQHALVDLLRAYPSYRGRARFERWVDRAAAVSVLRFARAVRRRDGDELEEQLAAPAGREVADGAARGDRGPRSFEQYLTLLQPTTREVLLLRHALGFPIAALAEALQTSTHAAKEQLLIARRALRALVRRRGTVAGNLGAGAQRWCALRDREALGEVLSASEQAELSALEARDAEVWAFVAQVRALELYFDPARVEPQLSDHHALVERAVLALQVTAPSASRHAADSEAELERAMEPEGSKLVRLLALGTSIALAVSTGLALMLYRPPVTEPLGALRSDQPDAQVAAMAAPNLTPTVEALSSARTSRRGARLRIGMRTLGEGTSLAIGDVVESAERTACLQLEPAAELCLPAWSALRVLSLYARERSFELVRGRVVTRIGERAGGAAVHVGVGELSLSAREGTFGVERTPDGSSLRARAIKGALEARRNDIVQQVDEGRALLYRAGDDALQVAPLSPALAQRDLDVLAAGVAPLLASAAPRNADGQAKSSAAERTEAGVSPAPGPPASAAEPAHAEAPGQGAANAAASLASEVGGLSEVSKRVPEAETDAQQVAP
jgi:RNA polymerase sigma factor (sigma-70 family)